MPVKKGVSLPRKARPPVMLPLRSMSLFTTRAPITITCNNRLAPYLAAEVESLGFKADEKFITGLRLTGTLNDCIPLNLSLRCASQGLYSLHAFDATDANALYDNLKNYPWETVLPEDGYFSVTSNGMNETINNNLFANLRVKDAI